MLGESLRWLGLGVEAGVEWGWERGYNPTSLQKDVEVFFFFSLSWACATRFRGGTTDSVNADKRIEPGELLAGPAKANNKIMSILQKPQPISSLALS